MDERGIDPADPDLTVGQRIRYFRERRGIAREVLGGLIGRNGRWVKAVERGEIGEPKLPTLLNLAEALKLRDVARLTGGGPMPTTMFRGPGHPALGAVRDAINTVAVSMTDPPPPLAHLQARLDAAWRARHLADGGAGGVTDDRDVARRHVREGLAGALPGAWWRVRRVALCPLGRAVYVDLGPVAEARRDAASDSITWHDA